METPPHRCWVEISRKQITENYHCARRAAGGDVEMACVVKADAYGHGAAEVSRALVAEGAKWLAVSSVEEGVRLRDAGLTTRILIMADFLPYEREALLAYGLTPVIHTLEGIAELDRTAAAAGVPIGFHLKLDTGMTRLGTRRSGVEILAALSSITHARMEGLMTHFASSADYTRAQTDEQLARFESVRACLSANGVQPRYVHVSSSNPIAYGRREAWYNMVRPGHLLYGYVSPPRGNAPPCVFKVRPALSWKTRILAVKDVPQGAEIGYGGMCRASQPIKIAILAAGYADGIPHRLSNRGKVLANGQLVPILGAVSMDLTTIDITTCPRLRPGDAVTLLGRDGEVGLGAQEIARAAGTISYNVLCSISARVKRIYL